MNVGPASLPRVIAVPIPPVTSATSFRAFCHGVTAFVSATSAAFCCEGAWTGGGKGLGAGGRRVPFCRTMDPRTTSSSKSMVNRPSPPMDSKNLVILFE